MGTVGDLSNCLQRLWTECPFGGFTLCMNRDSSRKISNTLHPWCLLQNSDYFCTTVVALSGTSELGSDIVVGYITFLAWWPHCVCCNRNPLLKVSPFLAHSRNCQEQKRAQKSVSSQFPLHFLGNTETCDHCLSTSLWNTSFPQLRLG